MTAETNNEKGGGAFTTTPRAPDSLRVRTVTVESGPFVTNACGNTNEPCNSMQYPMSILQRTPYDSYHNDIPNSSSSSLSSFSSSFLSTDGPSRYGRYPTLHGSSTQGDLVRIPADQYPLTASLLAKRQMETQPHSAMTLKRLPVRDWSTTAAAASAYVNLPAGNGGQPPSADSQLLDKIMSHDQRCFESDVEHYSYRSDFMNSYKRLEFQGGSDAAENPTDVSLAAVLFIV